MYAFSFLHARVLTVRHLPLRQDWSGGRGTGVAQWNGAIVHAPVPAAPSGRRWVRGRGAVGGWAWARGGAAVIGEQVVFLKTFALELHVKVLQDFLRQLFLLLNQFLLQLRVHLHKEC